MKGDTEFRTYGLATLIGVTLLALRCASMLAQETMPLITHDKGSRFRGFDLGRISMRIVGKCLVRSAVLAVFLSANSIAQQTGRIESMKLLTPDVGWAATTSQLFWTTDGGAKWKDVTPKIAPGQSIDSVFFLDTSVGWALLISEDADADGPRFDLASTADAGASWLTRRVKIPDLSPRGITLTGGGHIDFVDPLHGWMNLPVVSSAAFRLGVLVATSDGGMTWELSPGGSGTGGSIRFTSTKDGWVAGGAAYEHLYETHDGAKSWHEVTLKAPPELGKAMHPAYEQAPVFENGKRGFLPVTFSAAEGTPSELVLFASDDGGNSWRLDREIPLISKISIGQWIPSTVADSELITVSSSDHLSPKLTRVSPGNKVVTMAAVIPGGRGVDHLSFASPDRGWAAAGDRLLLTVDGGASWTDVTPRFVVRPSGSNRVPAREGPPRESDINGSLIPAALTGTTVRLGFDRCAAPTTGNMQTWWNSSPFFDIGIYLGGTSRSCPNPNLISGWVTTVQGQGWGLIPIWSGPQAPCACDANLPPPCTPFPHVFSSTPGVAEAQGVAEATSAMKAASGLGLGQTGIGSIIYYDMEPYTPLCRTAVESFISGWRSQLNNNLYLDGVYGAPADANNDWAYASYPPSNVWIAKYGTNNQNAPVVSIWGLTPLCDPFSVPPCSLWSDNQRMHQYLGINKTATYGGVKLDLDYDIVDATIVVKNATKTHTYSIATITYPGADTTYPENVNDEGLVVGAIVYVFAPGKCQPGCTCPAGTTDCWLAFTTTNGTYSSFGVTGAVFTFPYAVNNLGTIVGCWSSGGYECEHGFIKSSGGTPMSVDYPGAYSTSLTGINDSGQVVGYFVSTTDGGAFVYSGGAFAPINFPGGSGLEPSGVDGAGQVFGDNSDASCGGSYRPCGFIYSIPTGQFIKNFQYQGQQTNLYGVNNNGQAIGTASDGNFSFVYDENTNTYTALPFCSGPCAFGINDQGQIVGFGSGRGILATPQ